MKLELELELASRKKAKIKLALQGPSGSGKTMSALLLAYGLCGDWSSVAVVDTENRSSELYSHLGNYNVVNMSSPFIPERFCEAIKLCEGAGIGVIILDGISAEWESILEIHSNMAGNSFTNWSRLTPRHNAFIQTILQSPCHIIATIRSKQDYVLQEKNGKMVPEKVGLKGVTREDASYEFTLVFDLDIKNNATSSKDRTQLFNGKPDFKISIDTGKKILEWCNLGEEQPTSVIDNYVLSIEEKIHQCSTMKDLVALFNSQSKEVQEKYKFNFTQKRNELLPPIDETSITHLTNPQSNGSISTITS
jgi:hypothetical protein